MQVVIHDTSKDKFDYRVNLLMQDGYRVVPGTYSSTVVGVPDTAEDGTVTFVREERYFVALFKKTKVSNNLKGKSDERKRLPSKSIRINRSSGHIKAVGRTD